MEQYIAPIEELIERLRLLPGVGRRSAAKYAMRIIDLPEERARALADAIIGAKTAVRRCRRCFNLTEGELCRVCEDDTRDNSIICVVEDVRALMSLERVRGYRGSYHVLEGTISPMEGRGPESLRVAELLARIEAEGSPVREVILATGSTVDGETTAMYIASLLGGHNIRVTRIAYGIPVGGELEFADEVTLGRAIDGRRPM
jgi:recombination protein RecR